MRFKFVPILIVFAMLCTQAFGQTTARDFVDKGNAFYNQSNYDEAIKAYEEAIRLDPKYAMTWYDKVWLSMPKTGTMSPLKHTIKPSR